MVQQPVVGMNHPSWNVGHMVLSLQAIGREIGLQPCLDEEWCEVFGMGSQPSADPARYPAKSVLLAALADGRDRVVRQLSGMTDEELTGPLPDARYRNVFPSLGHAVLHILAGHLGVHIGQIRAWRRAALLPPVGQPDVQGD